MIASINRKSEVSTKKNEPKREKRDTVESILVQKSGAALAVLPDRRRRPCGVGNHWLFNLLSNFYRRYLGIYFLSSTTNRFKKYKKKKNFNVLCLKK